MQEQLNGQKVKVAADGDRLQASMAHVEASLSEQQQMLALMMADLEKIKQSLQNRQGDSHDDHAEVLQRTLEEENGVLRIRVQELEKLLATSAEGARDHEGVGGDHELLRQLLKDEQGASPNAAALDKLRAENEGLTQLLQAKEQEINTMKKQAAPTKPGAVSESDLESYEAELNQYRRELDEERTRLTEEVEQMRQRNAELDETVREMEMAMSRERAELARERTRLDRMREEVQREMERLQRDAPVRESLVSVQRLREEMNKGKQLSPANQLNDRLKNVRNK